MMEISIMRLETNDVGRQILYGRYGRKAGCREADGRGSMVPVGREQAAINAKQS